MSRESHDSSEGMKRGGERNIEMSIGRENRDDVLQRHGGRERLP